MIAKCAFYIQNAVQDLIDEDADEDDQKEYLQCNAQYYIPKKKVSLIFVGQTGVGKTTLLRSINDCINGVPFEKVCYFIENIVVI